MEDDTNIEDTITATVLDDVISSDELYVLLHKENEISQLSLKDYEKIIKFCSVVDESILIQNDSEKHATIMFKYFLDVVNESVNIYADTLGGNLGNDIVLTSIFKNFFAKKPNVRTIIIYKSEPEDNEINKLLKRMSINYPNQIELFRVNEEISESILPKNYFSTFDEIRFRLVLDEPTSNAVCNFYEPNYTRQFNHEFQALLNIVSRIK